MSIIYIEKYITTVMSGLDTNPFVVLENFAKDFILACRGVFVRSLILKGTESMEEMSWRYLGKGVVEYTYSDTITHPAGYHHMGRVGCVDFASFSAWEERVRRSHDWNVVLDRRPGREKDVSASQRAYADVMIPFMDLVFSDHPVSYAWVRDEVMPAFDLIKKYW